MAADDILWRDGPVAAPMNYTVPNGGELIPKSVIATLDGTSAASEFFAVLQIIDPNGHVLSTSASTAIAAGGSASVSWFPGPVGAGAGGTPGSGAWTQVFHQDLPAGTIATSIDTLGSTWDSNTNQIFGLFMGASKKASSPDELYVVFNADTAGHNVYNREWGDANTITTPGTLHNDAGGTDVHGTLGLAGALGDSDTATGIFFVIPKVYQSSQSGKLIAFGGYAGISTGVNGITVNSYTFSAISRLTLTWKSGAQFQDGSSLTLWAV